uniref:Secreted protein n=1 Tax=Anguilla anguilla TaxID=7936 RepID=A0A0E9PFF8_ANGAN
MFIVFVLSVAKVLVNSLSWLMCSYCFTLQEERTWACMHTFFKYLTFLIFHCCACQPSPCCITCCLSM